MALRRILSVGLCLVALPATGAETCPERFRIVGWPGGGIPSGRLDLADFHDGPVVVSGADVADAVPAVDASGGPAVRFTLTPAGRRAFGVYTAAHIGEPLAIIHDDRLLVAPMIRDAITGGQGIITGIPAMDETTEIAAQLRDRSCPSGS